MSPCVELCSCSSLGASPEKELTLARCALLQQELDFVLLISFFFLLCFLEDSGWKDKSTHL